MVAKRIQHVAPTMLRYVALAWCNRLAEALANRDVICLQYLQVAGTGRDVVTHILYTRVFYWKLHHS